MADDQGRPTLMEEFQQIKAIRNALGCDVPKASQLWRSGVRMVTLTEGRQSPEPRTWVLPPEPGPEVVDVRTRDGDVFRHGSRGWHHMDNPLRSFSWRELLNGHAPLTDATGDV